MAWIFIPAYSFANPNRKHNPQKTQKEIADTVDYYLCQGGDPASGADGAKQLNAVLRQAYGEDLSKMEGGASVVESLRRCSVLQALESASKKELLDRKEEAVKSNEAAQAVADTKEKLQRYYQTHNPSKSEKDVHDTVHYYLVKGGDPNAPGDGVTQLNNLLKQSYGEDLSGVGKPTTTTAASSGLENVRKERRMSSDNILSKAKGMFDQPVAETKTKKPPKKSPPPAPAAAMKASKKKQPPPAPAAAKKKVKVKLPPKKSPPPAPTAALAGTTKETKGEPAEAAPAKAPSPLMPAAANRAELLARAKDVPAAAGPAGPSGPGAAAAAAAQDCEKQLLKFYARQDSCRGLLSIVAQPWSGFSFPRMLCRSTG